MPALSPGWRGYRAFASSRKAWRISFSVSAAKPSLKNGRGRMPAVGSDWTAAQIAGIVHYLRQTKGGASGG